MGGSSYRGFELQPEGKKLPKVMRDLSRRASELFGSVYFCCAFTRPIDVVEHSF